MSRSSGEEGVQDVLNCEKISRKISSHVHLLKNFTYAYRSLYLRDRLKPQMIVGLKKKVFSQVGLKIQLFLLSCLEKNALAKHFLGVKLSQKGILARMARLKMFSISQLNTV